MLLGICVIVGAFILLVGVSKYRTGYFLRQFKGAVACPASTTLIGVLDKLGNYDYPDVFVLHDWTKQYGRTYAIQKGWRNILVTSDPKIIYEMVNSKFDFFHERERLPMRANMDKERIVHVFRARGQRWKRLRALLQPVFAIKNLKRLVPIIEDSASKMVDFLANAAKTNDEFDVQPFCQQFSMDVILRVVLGHKKSCQFEADHAQVLHETLNDNRSLLSNISWIFPPLGPICYNIRWLISRLQNRGITVLMRRVKEAIRARKAEREAGKGGDNTDFIDFFLDAESDQVHEDNAKAFGRANSSPSKTLTIDEIAAQCKFFSIAGFDTVTNTLTLILFYLAKFPGVQERLRQEFENLGDELSYEALKTLKYAEAVIKETLRVQPIATNSFGRTCAKTTTLGDLTIEEGTIILVDLFELHTDKELWGPSADEFMPERWIDGNIPRSAYYPFGGGPRICIGRDLAYIELKLVLIHLLRRFKIMESANTGEAPVLVSNTVLNVKHAMIHLESIE